MDKIRTLFQKYVDKTINAEELEMFYAYIQQPDHTPPIQGLLKELSDYIELTEKHESNAMLGELAKKNQRLEARMKKNEEDQALLAVTLGKINKEYKSPESTKKKRSLWARFKSLYGIVLIVLTAGAWYFVSNQQSTTAVAFAEKIKDYGQK